MLFVSSTGSRKKNIHESIRELHENGFSNIELTGGTRYYPALIKDITLLQRELNLNLLVHNYFPPPEVDFVLNLASLNDKISKKSLALCKHAIDLSCQVGADKVSFHPGFLVDIPVEQIGGEIVKTQLFDKEKSLNHLYENYSLLLDYAKGEIDIYLENNVFSQTNATAFEGINPFILTEYADYCEMRENLKFPLLLDVAHLKITAKTLHLDFHEQLYQLMQRTDYLHICDNDGLQDQHQPFTSESTLLKELAKFEIGSKTVTLEINSEMSMLKQSYTLIKKMQ